MQGDEFIAIEHYDGVTLRRPMRDHKIDILRFVGLAMIILAHVNPPSFLFQIRNFDVPLMVLVSGLSFSLSYKPTEPFFSYLWKRIKRLVFPVWIFLTLYFTVLYFIAPHNGDFTGAKIVQSYALLEGIGYVWIIRVFLLVAITSPWIFSWNERIKSDSKYLLTLLCALGIYEVFRYYLMGYVGANPGKFLSLFIHYIISYSLIFALGLRLPQLAIKKLHIITLINLVLFCIISALLFIKNGKFIPTQNLKYPPSLYYFSYSLFVSVLLWTYRSHLEWIMNKLSLRRPILFIAQNSLWVYLWHIILIKIFQEVPWIKVNFITEYFIVFGFSTLIVFAQVSWITQVLLKQDFLSDAMKKNLKILLTG